MSTNTCSVTQRRRDGFRGDDIKTYGELARRAIERIVLYNVRAMISGPITTGGVASKGVTDPTEITRQNLEIFDRAIRYVQAIADCSGGPNVWDQMPYEKVIARLVDDEKSSPDYGGYPMRLLEEFYLPVFTAAEFADVYMIPGWECSTGATWEKERLEALGTRVAFLPDDFLLQAASFGIY